jgi:tetratricopeptide (TPR) repeat protein
MNHKYSECVILLQKIKVLPNEGATDGRTVWRNANIGNALDFMKAEKYSKALESISKARQWPLNLGAGKPYNPDERFEDFIALQCYKKMKDNKSAVGTLDKIIGKTALQNLSFDENDFLTAWLLKDAGNTSEGDKIMKELLAKNPLSKSVQWCNAVYAGEPASAGFIRKEMANSDRFTYFLNLMFNDPRILGSHISTKNPK